MRGVEVVECNETTAGTWQTLLIAVTYTLTTRQAGLFTKTVY